MKKNIIITGFPKSGKSTLLKEIINNYFNPKSGFVTKEILHKQESTRLGFTMENEMGETRIFAHTDQISQYHHIVGKYKIDLSCLDEFVAYASNTVHGLNRDESLVYIDEIGQMQLLSENFCIFVKEMLDSPHTIIATMKIAYEHPFITEIKKRSDTIIMEIDPDNRYSTWLFIDQLILKIAKARAYLKEPSRFIMGKRKIKVQGEHGIHTVSLLKKGNTCDCNFFTQYQKYTLCSHIIAVSELLQK